jgi:phosphatidylserine decarboxylase
MEILGVRFPFDPDCKTWAAIPAVPALVGFLFGWGWIWVVCLLLTLAVLAFFRDPPRRVPRTPGAVVSPADGKIDMIQTNQDPEAGPVGGPCITIFLSVLDVHINRAPCAGEVVSLRRRPGLFLNALNPDSTTHNEANLIRMRCGRFEVTVNQIAGVIARRIVCRVQPGRKLRRGERVGLIRFGSRTQLCLPPEARLQAEVGERVTGGVTVLAYLPEEE